MGWYEREVVPRLVNITCANRRMLPLRRRALSGVNGTVLELGFGSGANLDAYPGTVDRVVAIDPSLVGRKLAAKRLSRSPIHVEFAGLDADRLALEDESVDNAVSTWTLCTIPDATAAVREVRRVLKPGGRFFFLEHGLSPDPKVARRQHRYDGLQGRIAGGCHLDRDITQIIEAAGFDVENKKNFYIAGPKALSYMYAGQARPS
jgi:SAM-dependent methyltransferase